MFIRKQTQNPRMKELVALKRAGVVLEGQDLSLLFGLLGEKDSLDVGENTSLSNGDSSQELVQFFVVTDGQLQVTGDDTGLLVVTGSIACQFEDFSGQVFHDGSQLD